MFKKIIASLLAFVLLFNTVGPLYSSALASNSTESEIDLNEIQRLLENMELTDEEYENIIETTIILEDGQTRVIQVPIFVIAVHIVVRGSTWAINKYGKKLVNEAKRSKAHSAALKIKSSLLDEDGVKLHLFTDSIRGSQDLKDPDTKWVISRDVGKGNAHGGSYWKLMDKKGKRIATLDKDGRVLRD